MIRKIARAASWVVFAVASLCGLVAGLSLIEFYTREPGPDGIAVVFLLYVSAAGAIVLAVLGLALRWYGQKQRRRKSA